MANFVEFTAPVGLVNMDFVYTYGASLVDGVYGIELKMGNGGNKIAVYPNTGVKASLTHGNLIFTAQDAGVAGNSITVALVNGGLNQVLGVVVTGTDIVVNVATDGAGAITSTEAEVQNALNNDVDAVALISTSNGGVAVTTAIIATALSGGTNDTSEATRDAFIGTIDTAFKL